MSRASASDWLMLAALAAMWGSAFMFIKIAVAHVPPLTLVAGRLAVSALALLVLARAAGLRLPRSPRTWTNYALLALLGNAIPFFLIAHGQRLVDSAVAGILIAVMPLATVLLAHVFGAGDPLSRARIAGFAMGFLGIVALMEPATASGLGGSTGEVLSQLAILGAALCYAGNSVLARLTVKGEFLAAAAGTLTIATIVVAPLALALDRPWQLAPDAASIASIAWLGIGPTALATILYFRLISSAGPAFMSLVNYLAPCVALGAGVALLDETPGAHAYAALALILGGIGVSQVRR
ncbi:MAG: DMT family transporter [Burkholderiales bacterium]|nr:DMT family transporter [Burkholderiales bacterium]